MTVELALLALLSARPMSGYDLKKLLAESESLPWSGNNNQVYRALVELHRQGFATLEIQQPAEGPARKLYAITAAGREAVREWLLSEPEAPHLRAPILARLAGADLLSADQLDTVLARYAEDVHLTLLGLEEMQRRGVGPRFGTERQQLVWSYVNARPLRMLRAEEEWVGELRWALAKLESNAAAPGDRGTRGW